jgi:hypothetical protein
MSNIFTNNINKTNKYKNTKLVCFNYSKKNNIDYTRHFPPANIE